MTDQNTPATPMTASGAAPTLRALSQFVKDLSFENPANALPDGQPNIDIGIDVSAFPRDEGQGVYETSLKLNARAHIGEATLFLMELDYCGLFQVLGLGEAETEAALLIECPRMLFPFARRLVADITREGGFPPLLIDPVDFVHLYRQQKQRQDQEAAASAAAAAAAPFVPPAPAPAPVPEPAPVQADVPAQAPAPTPADAPPSFTPHTPPPQPVVEAAPAAPPPAEPVPPSPAPATEPAPAETPSAPLPTDSAAPGAEPASPDRLPES